MPTVCVTLAEESPEQLLAAQRAAIASGAKLVEWRLDFLQGTVDVAGLVAQRLGPIVFTCRLPADGGRWERPEAERRQWLTAAMAAGAEYVDLEAPTAAEMPRTGSSQRIVSLHDFQGTPADLPAEWDRLAACDADVIKLATLATSTSDGVRMLNLIATSKLPTVGLCMGEIGLFARILSGKFGAPFTYAAGNAARQLAPGLLTQAQLAGQYRYEQITPATAIYGVIGDPIAHSHSPLIHNAGLVAAGIDAVYLPFRVPADDLKSFLTAAPSLGIRGLSVTIPHKEAVLEIATQHDELVDGAGAANTLVWRNDHWAAYNTDITGALGSLRACWKREAHALNPLNGTSVLVLGAGGASRAIAYGLRRSGASVTVTGRTLARSQELAAELGVQSVPWETRGEVRCQALINTSPVGMSPHIGDTPFEPAWLHPGQIVFDTIYNPRQTRLLREAAAVGCITLSGVEMFLQQAAAQFELFTGQPAPFAALRTALQQMTPAPSAAAAAHDTAPHEATA